MGGGLANKSTGDYSTIAGGSEGTNSGPYGAISGGHWNTNRATYGTVPGGLQNYVGASFGFAAGRRAKVNHTGSFVWGDSANAAVASTATDQFTIRASGGVRLTQDAGATTAIDVGERYRDNATIAWARVAASTGTAAAEFGVASIANPATGTYNITLDATATDASHLVPIAIAEVDGLPTSAAAARLVTINQTGTSTFTVYITTGAFAAVNNDFVFTVTGR